MKKGIYLASYKAFHPGYDIIYQDINGKRDIAGDMLEVDLSSYDYIIASPPCNFYSRANYRRFISDYSLNTKHLLPSILDKLCSLNKPFIVENVQNRPLMANMGLFNFPCFVYFIGRHTYWSNIMFFVDVNQFSDNIQYLSSSNRQGGLNVNLVIDSWLKCVNE